MYKAKKRGQVALFVTVAVLIVLAILLLLLAPRFRTSIQGIEGTNPSSYLQTCLNDDMVSALQKVGEGGGYIQPEGNILYQGKEVKYLCYTNEYYLPCVVQEPFIKERIDSELTKALQGTAEFCMDSYSEELRRRGAQVVMGEINTTASLSSNGLNVKVDVPLTITQEVSRTFSTLEANAPTKMYDLALIASSIVAFEASYGDSETTLYARYYPDLKINKIKLSEGSTIYILEDINSKETFTFASRSVAWPPGSELQ